MRLADSGSEPEVASRESQSARGAGNELLHHLQQRLRPLHQYGGAVLEQFLAWAEPRGRRRGTCRPGWRSACRCPCLPGRRIRQQARSFAGRSQWLPRDGACGDAVTLSEDHLKRVPRQERLNALLGKAVGLIGQHRHAKCLRLQPLEQRIHARVGRVWTFQWDS